MLTDSPKSRGSSKECPTPVAESSSPEHGQQPTSMEELQQHLSESFSKTVQEWERIKTQRIKDGGSPVPMDMAPTSSTVSPRTSDFKRSRKQERSKSRERDRSRSKYSRQREREKQKIEKKEHKIEKEKEKLEKMKKKLEDLVTMSEAEVQGLSQEFTRKLHEWEVMKGIRKEKPLDGSQPISQDGTEPQVTHQPFKRRSPRIHHGRCNSAKHHKEEKMEIKRDRTQSEKRERTHSENRESTTIQSERRERTLSETMVEELSSQGSEAKLGDVSQARSSSVPSFTSRTDQQLVDESTSIDLNLTSDTVIR